MQITLTKEQPESFWDFLFPKRVKNTEELIVDFEEKSIIHKLNGANHQLTFLRLDQIELQGDKICLTIIRPDSFEPLIMSFGPVANPSAALRDLKKAWLEPLKDGKINPPKKKYSIFAERTFVASAQRYNIPLEQAPYIGAM